MMRSLFLLPCLLLLSSCVLPGYDSPGLNPAMYAIRQRHLNTLDIAGKDEHKALAIIGGNIETGFTRDDVMAAWGPPVACDRVWGTSRTVCLYSQSTRMYVLDRRYTDYTYRSAYFIDGKVVDWQYH